MKKVLLVLMLSLFIVGCSKTDDSKVEDENPIVDNGMENDEEKEDINDKEENKTMYENPIATIKFKDLGEMTFELKVNDAPQSVFNFTELANKGYYDGLVMHRMIDGFVAQGGDPQGTGMGGPGYSIKGEFSNNRVDNPTQHDLGAIAFARSMARDSAGSQFYIVTGNYDPMNMKRMNEDYAAFGNILSGVELIDVINSEYASADGTPQRELVVESITVDTKGQELPSPDKLQ